VEISGNSSPSDFILNKLSDEKSSGQKAGADPSGNVINNFGDMLKGQINHLNQLSNESADAVKSYAVGGPVEIHNVMLAMEKSSTAMQLAVQVRNKILAGYQELMRLSI
jgi:flagellar hook-basal body complex protein FliE